MKIWKKEKGTEPPTGQMFRRSCKKHQAAQSKNGTEYVACHETNPHICLGPFVKHRREMTFCIFKNRCLDFS